MAYRIGNLVEEAEFFFRRKNSFHGYPKLKGREAPYVVELVGSPAKELQGKRIFVTADSDIAVDPLDPRLIKGLHSMQKGAAGEMTAARWVRYHGCAPCELAKRAAAGEMPPF